MVGVIVNLSLPDCSNAVDDNPVETYIEAFSSGKCRNCGALPDCPGCPPDECTYAHCQAVQEKGGEASSASSDWAVLWVEYCDLVKAVEDLEDKIEALQTQLEALEEIRDDECGKPPPNNCAAAQAAVDAKQAEIDAKEAEKEEKEAERDAKLEEANEKEAEADAAAAESISLANETTPEGAQYLYSSAPGNEPWADTACDRFGREPQRCRVWWSVYVKTHLYTPHSEWHGKWGLVMGGGYTPSGQPFVTLIPGCGGVSAYACISCGDEPCKYGCGGTSYTWEVRMMQTFPNTTLEGETC